jgi:hypothetical protein
VIHQGKPVLVEGKKLYEVTYDNRLLMKLLAGRDREKYGDVKVIEVNWKICSTISFLTAPGSALTGLPGSFSCRFLACRFLT